MAAPTLLNLIRHAEVETRYQGVFGGRIDMALSPRGHEQAAALGRYLRPRAFDLLYASPMKRVQQTVAACRTNGAPEPVVLTRLHEVDFGDWTGLSFAEVEQRFGVRASTWLDQLTAGNIPNAESAADYRARIEHCLCEILAAPPGARVAVFCHGGVIRQILALLLDLPLPKMAGFEIDYASLTQIEIHPRRVEVQLLNLTPWRDLQS